MREERRRLRYNNIFRNTLLKTQYYILYDIVKYDSLNYDKWYIMIDGGILKKKCAGNIGICLSVNLYYALFEIKNYLSFLKR